MDGTRFQNLAGLLDEHELDVAAIAEALMPFHDAREATYKRSFAKRGEVGIWMNLARKYDRFDALAADVFSDDGKENITLIDTLVDLALYSLKWLAVIRRIRPEDMEQWIDEVYLRNVEIDPMDAFILFGMQDQVSDDDSTSLVDTMLAESVHDMPLDEALAAIRKIVADKMVVDSFDLPGRPASSEWTDGALAAQETHNETW